MRCAKPFYHNQHHEQQQQHFIDISVYLSYRARVFFFHLLFVRSIKSVQFSLERWLMPFNFAFSIGNVRLFVHTLLYVDVFFCFSRAPNATQSSKRKREQHRQREKLCGTKHMHNGPDPGETKNSNEKKNEN